MPGTFANISYGCESNGTGFISIDAVGSDYSEVLTVNFFSAGGGYGPYSFPPESTPFKITGVANATYTASVSGSESGQGDVFLNGSPTAFDEFEISCTPPVTCDLEITNLSVNTTSPDTPNGSVSATVYGVNGTKEYSIDGVNWQTLNSFYFLGEGHYTLYARYQEQPSCVVSEPFYVGYNAVFGCTNPDADNYNPAATTDDGTCEFTPRYHATGGTLANPVYFERTFATEAPGPTPTPKDRHYITVNLYLPGEPVPFASVRQRIRNGVAKVDISKELRQGQLRIREDLSTIQSDTEALFAYEVGYVESYNGEDQPEIRPTQPKRYAVRAALPGLHDTLAPYVVVPDEQSLTPAQFLTSFEEPVMFAGEPVSLAVMIDPTMYSEGKTIYFERSYFDVYGRLVERKNDPVYATGYVRLTVYDTPLPCAAYLEAVLTDQPRTHAADCIDEPPTPPEPPVPGSPVTIKDGAGNTLATVPSGGTFVIESGFSFGFRIL